MQLHEETYTVISRLIDSFRYQCGMRGTSAFVVFPELHRGFVCELCFFPSSLHSVETEAGVEYRNHSVPPRVYNPHHSTLAASTLSMDVLVNRCSFPVQTHNPHTQKCAHTHDMLMQTIQNWSRDAAVYTCHVMFFCLFTSRYSRLIPPRTLV